MGYIPDDFSIDQAGSDYLVSEDHALYWEWYTSEAYFIILIESMPSHLGEIKGEELILEEITAAQVIDPHDQALAGGILDIESFDTGTTYQIIVPREDIVVEVITNLPRKEAITAAEALIPSLCLNKPAETPGE